MSVNIDKEKFDKFEEVERVVHIICMIKQLDMRLILLKKNG